MLYLYELNFTLIPIKILPEISMYKRIKNVAVLGSGVMGSVYATLANID